MKPLPILSVTLFAVLSAGALVVNSCGGGSSLVTDAMPMTPTIDASPPDALVPLHCDPVTGTNLALEEVVSGLSDPLFVDAPKNDERLFVVEQPGRIVIVKNDALLPAPFLDVRGIVRNLSDEQGLLGLAFHPNYATNGRFFINYTAASPSGATVVAEYTVSADADVANTTGKILLTIGQPESNHNGGMLAFGPDGYLYIGTGDGGGSGDQHGATGNGQDLNTHLGKLLRIDIDSGAPYAIPSDNPYASGGGLAEIWAYGLRNPWRFSFDRMTGDLYIADVGQDKWGEVNVLPGTTAGANYGWRIVEGPECFNPVNCDKTGTVAPVHEYPHNTNPRSITGGYVYRGDCLPQIKGRYFFGDYVTEQVFSFEYQGGTATNVQELTSDIDPNSDIFKLTSFGEDGFGELYVVGRDGKVFRIVVIP